MHRYVNTGVSCGAHWKLLDQERTAKETRDAQCTSDVLAICQWVRVIDDAWGGMHAHTVGGVGPAIQHGRERYDGVPTLLKQHLMVAKWQ